MAKAPATKGGSRRASAKPTTAALLRAPHVIARKPLSIWRIHSAKYRAAEFHPGGTGNARFSPIYRVNGSSIPTLYGASTFDGALMESVFRAVPTPPAHYILDFATLRDEQLVVSRIRPRGTLKLIDLSTKGLKRLGLTRADLIDTPLTSYPETRKHAEQFHAGTAALGLAWTSRQDDEAAAVMLFGDRVGEDAFKVELDREPLWLAPHIDAVVELAERIGIDEIHGT
jgi:RES domain